MKKKRSSLHGDSMGLVDTTSMNSIKQPSPMNFSGGGLSETWTRWKQRWQLYIKASGINEKTQDVQCTIFLMLL